jgi:formate dehydrogenase accessory protein FdhD
MTPARQVESRRWSHGESSGSVEAIAEETPVALVYNGISHAVMMATPQDLEDFALGFSLTEGILDRPDELLDCEPRATAQGIEMALTITSRRFAALSARRRNLTGRTGCGLCGVDSLDQALRPLREVRNALIVSPAAIMGAMAALPKLQAINREVHALHAAAWALPDGTVAEIREDVGRHNALDKLLGGLARAGVESQSGFAVVTSRCSYEMVQKAVARGIGLLVAVSAPTALALRLAEAAGLTLVARAHGEGYRLYTHPHRIAARQAA